MAAARALIVDDEPDIRTLVGMTLERMGLGIDEAGDLAQARARLSSGSYALCLTDMRLPDGNGLDLVDYIQSRHPGLPVAVITAHGNMDTAIRALKSGAFDFLTKPVEIAALRELVRHALQPQRRGDSPDPRLLIGTSTAIDALREQIAKLARNQAPVFIRGESGTGKEVVARLIHELGPRGNAPFVPVNCGAIPAELMESELFGHKKGSFTGANSEKAGLFQCAQGGTLFLDEVGELPLPMQVKLLRAIQERAVRPVGGNEEIPVDVRILSASHRDLAKLVADGAFRQDLYYRINVIELRIPPLRERASDIPALATHILERLAEREGGPAKTLSAQASAALMHYPFPGNVRELENILERACALSDGDTLQSEDLHLPDASPTMPMATTTGTESPPPRTELFQRLDEQTEKTVILKMLDETRWNRTEAARRLGLTLRQLRYRLQKWGME
ncbi:MAG: sigma-54 dependent transcriptional regulator [Halothiobacillaceae bacterium]|nr:sigma-54 dependent transcriptional regulator [Halothiobacillaceae bacterium]MDY0049143.1 sigma-54 dependent transcriptional regulator [Halothiobacillaceae bacterium]